MEITRSYSQKLNTGNYTTCDYFCSASIECDEKEADAKSKWLIDFCEAEVKKSIEEKLTPKRVDTGLGEKWQENYNQRSITDQIEEQNG